MTALPILAVQYLESPYPDATITEVRRRLHNAFERLPISLVLLGWELPIHIEEAVAVEAALHNAKLFRWQPLLTGDAHTDLPPEWATIGPNSNSIPGHGGLPEFSFICPNRIAVADFISERVESVAASGLYQGLFLDRIRYPSPSIDPLRYLACFCKSCTRLAADYGLDLESVRHNINSRPVEVIVRSLFGKPAEIGFPFEPFLTFRKTSITRSVQMVSRLARGNSLAIGLDCFSPALTSMVGQDLSALHKVVDWIKIMVYPRVFGPAGLPFELINLIKWLTHSGLAENEAVQLLAEASGLFLPVNGNDLRRHGLESAIITQEIQRGKELGITVLLAGIAMVNMEKIHTSSPEQIQTDLVACGNADGLVISWDLWSTPLSYLDKIRNFWC